jgi:hypothetical protein
MAVLRALAQNLLGRLASDSIDCTMFIMVWLNLCNTVVFRRVGWSSGMCDSMAWQPLLGDVANVFTAVVGLEHLDMAEGLVGRDESLELQQDLALCLHEVHLGLP